MIPERAREPDSLDDAEIRFEFSPALRRVIADSTHWAAVSRRAVLSFESRYSLRLYLFLSLRANLRKVSEDIALDDLRALLGVPDKTMVRWQDLRRFVLDRAIAEINHLAGFCAPKMISMIGQIGRSQCGMDSAGAEVRR